MFKEVMIPGKGEVEHLKQLNTLKFKKMQKFSFQRIELEVVCNIINTFQHNFVLHVVLIKPFWEDLCSAVTVLYFEEGTIVFVRPVFFEAMEVLLWMKQKILKQIQFWNKSLIFLF